MNTAQPVIRISEVSLRQRDLLVLDSISFEVSKGQFAAVIGPNGAGKTSLLRVILGIVSPDSGQVEVFGKPIHELGPLRSRIGYVPQIFNIDLSFPVSVYEAVLMGTYGQVGLARKPGDREHELAHKALERVGITDLAQRPIGRLSGGQRQRAFVARALVNEPELLVLDEPTTGVDVETSGSLYTLLRDLKHAGTTLVMVSHDVGVVADYLDTLLCLNRCMVAHGRPGEVVCAEVLRKMYGCDAAFLHHGEAPHIVVEDH